MGAISGISMGWATLWGTIYLQIGNLLILGSSPVHVLMKDDLNIMKDNVKFQLSEYDNRNRLFPLNPP